MTGQAVRRPERRDGAALVARRLPGLVGRGHRQPVDPEVGPQLGPRDLAVARARARRRSHPHPRRTTSVLTMSRGSMPRWRAASASDGPARWRRGSGARRRWPRGPHAPAGRPRSRRLSLPGVAHGPTLGPPVDGRVAVSAFRDTDARGAAPRERPGGVEWGRQVRRTRTEGAEVGDFDAMWRDLGESAATARTGGYHRFAWTREDHTLREWFVGEARAARARRHRRPGRQPVGVVGRPGRCRWPPGGPVSSPGRTSTPCPTVAPSTARSVSCRPSPRSMRCATAASSPTGPSGS